MTSTNACPRSNGLFTLDLEEITAALRNVVPDAQRLTPLAEGGTPLCCGCIDGGKALR